MQPPAPGDVFHGRYSIQSVLGRGGFAVVYLAVEAGSNRKVALKVLVPGAHGYPSDMRARFEREVRMVANLRDPHTVTMYDYGQTSEGLLFMVFEFVPGRDLEQILRADGSLPDAIAVHILEQVLEALREAHFAGLLHRDIKPENIRIFEYLDDPWCAKLLDFGVAKPTHASAERITRQGALVGTPHFMSPEQVFGGELTPASDIYALGLVAYEMLSGRPAVSGSGHHEVLREQVATEPKRLPRDTAVSDELRQIIERMMHREPSERFQSADEVLAALGRLPGRSQHSSGYRRLAKSGGSSPASRPTELEIAETEPIEGLRERMVARGETLPENVAGVANATAQPVPPAASAAEPSSLVSIVVMALGVVMGGGAVIAALQFLSADDEPIYEPPIVAAAADTSFEEPSISDDAPDAVLEAYAAVPEATHGVAKAVGAARESATPGGCGTVRKPGLHRHNASIGGVSREFAVHVPPMKQDIPAPAVMLFHDSRHLDATGFLVDTDFARVASEHGFYVVALRSESYSTIGEEAWSKEASEAAYAEDVFDIVVETYCIDPQRVFAVGEGSGTRLIESLRCTLPLAGIAGSGYLSPDASVPCRPREPVPYIYIAGETDAFNPVEGGKNCQGNDVVSLAKKGGAWARANGCGRAAKPRKVGARLKCTQYAGCGAETWMCSHPEGHAWPETIYNPFYTAQYSHCVGQPPRGVPMADVVWDFFETHGKPRGAVNEASR